MANTFNSSIKLESNGRSNLVKNKNLWWWVIGFVLVGLVVCGGLIGLGLWTAGLGDDSVGFGDAVAIIRVEGPILPGEAPPPNPFSGGGGVAYSETIIEQLEKADENEDVKAIILFVDSPGGSVFASDEIYLKIKELNKPIVTAMGSLAASGGYYVSAATDEIWASPHTLTCSIGVIMQIPNLEEFAEEFGVTMVVVKSGKFKDIGNPFREFTEEDRGVIQALIDEAYDAFVGIVAEGRNMSPERVRELADGRICSGKQAQEMGLVDQLGYLPKVIERAAELGNIEGEPRIIEYETEPGLFEALGASLYRPSPVQEIREILHFDAGSPLMYMYVGP
jgi:protease-4